MISARVHYFLRAINNRTSEIGGVVYAVFETAPTMRRDPVPCFAGFPIGWRPITGMPGIVHYDPKSTEQYWFCEVPRKTFHHFRELTEDEAAMLYPELPRRASQSATS
jgi:hypothetical protein